MTPATTLKMHHSKHSIRESCARINVLRKLTFLHLTPYHTRRYRKHMILIYWYPEYLDKLPSITLQMLLQSWPILQSTLHIPTILPIFSNKLLKTCRYLTTESNGCSWNPAKLQNNNYMKIKNKTFVQITKRNSTHLNFNNSWPLFA